MNSEESRQQVAVVATQQEEPVFNLDAKEFIPSFNAPTAFQMLPCKIQQNYLHEQLVNQNNLLTTNSSSETSEPWKNFPSSFFSMSVNSEPFRDQNGIQTHFKLSQAQWSFVYEFYPEYSQDPYELMQWLQEKASNPENFSESHFESGQPHQLNNQLQEQQNMMFEAWKQLRNAQSNQQSAEPLWGENYYGFNIEGLDGQQAYRQQSQQYSALVSGGSSQEQEYNWQHDQQDDDPEEDFDNAMEYYAGLYNEQENSSDNMDDDDLYDLYELQFDFEGDESEQDPAEDETAADSKTIQSESEDGHGECSKDYMDLEVRSEQENDDQIMDNDCFNKLKIINWSESDNDFLEFKEQHIFEPFQISSLAEDQEIMDSWTKEQFE